MSTMNLSMKAPSLEEVERRVQLNNRRAKDRERREQIIYPVVLVVAVLIIWEASTKLFGIPRYLLPAPTDIVATMISRFPLLLKEAWVTSIEVMLGFSLSVVIGVPLAMGIVRWKAFNTAIFPILVSAQTVPKVAVAPLFIVWFGFGLLPKILIAFLIAFFPIVINTVMGLKSIEKEKIYLAKSIGLSSFDTFRLIRIPDALPSIFAGMKISVTLAVVGAVVGEFVGGDAGLGYLLLIANGALDTSLLFCGIIVLTCLGFFYYYLIEFIERLTLPHLYEKGGPSDH
jgi:NitT/TauT family transport system permease protein